MQTTMQLRVCKSMKICSQCGKQIYIGKEYFSGSHSAMHVVCYETACKLNSIDFAMPELERPVQKQAEAPKDKTSDSSHTRSVPCYKCANPSIGEIYGSPVCGVHINDAVGDNV